MSELKRCLTCLTSREPSRNYYKSYSIWHKDGHLPICKNCLKDHIKDKEDNLSVIQEVMRVLDKPLKTDIWIQAMESKKETLGEYFRLINLNNGTDTYDDSDFEGHKTINNKDLTLSGDEIDEEVDIETVRYWGRGYDDWEYSFLEEEKLKLMTSFECPDYGMEMIMKDICFINLDIEKTRQERKDNSAKVITNLIKTRSDLMNDASMKPIQSTGADGNDQVTFGTLIKKWENERPIPKPIDDEMKEYIDTFIVGHLAKMEGLSNDMTEKYDRALSKYTIDFDEINRDDEEIED